jgi:hypothetical protein
VWCQLITLASKAERPNLASLYFGEAKAAGCLLTLELHNAHLAAQARTADLDKVCKHMWQCQQEARCTAAMLFNRHENIMQLMCQLRTSQVWHWLQWRLCQVLAECTL